MKMIPSTPTGDVLTDILDERGRQLIDLHYGITRDDLYTEGQLGDAGASYAMANSTKAMLAHNRNAPTIPRSWPWDGSTFATVDDDDRAARRRQLVKAAALVVAEIERLDRMTAREQAHADHLARFGGAK
jgi:hypothetical protein